MVVKNKCARRCGAEEGQMRSGAQEGSWADWGQRSWGRVEFCTAVGDKRRHCPLSSHPDLGIPHTFLGFCKREAFVFIFPWIINKRLSRASKEILCFIFIYFYFLYVRVLCRFLFFICMSASPALCLYHIHAVLTETRRGLPLELEL